MWKLLCHVGKILATLAVVSCEKAAEIAGNILNMGKDAYSWACEHLKDTPSHIYTALKAVALKELVFFIGGFLCIFVFDEARGDLTWFRRMVTSCMDFFSDLLKKSVEKVSENFTSFLIRKVYPEAKQM